MLGVDIAWYNSGTSNNFIGNESGKWNTSGSLNTFVGTESGFSSESGTGNAFLGNKAGYSNKSGSLNTFLGYSAGYGNTTGEKNTYVGYGAGGKGDIVNAAAIGASAKVTASNCLVLGGNANQYRNRSLRTCISGTDEHRNSCKGRPFELDDHVR